MSESGYRFCPVCATPLMARAEGGRERPSCPHGHFTHWGNPTPVVAALIEYEGRVLLARNAAWPAKMFALITGFLEAGESPVDGMAREVLEETALTVDTSTLIGVYEFARMNQIIVAYHAVASGQIRLSEELIDYRLVEPERVRPWRAGTGLAVADWLRARGLPVNFGDWPS